MPFLGVVDFRYIVVTPKAGITGSAALAFHFAAARKSGIKVVIEKDLKRKDLGLLEARKT